MIYFNLETKTFDKGTSLNAEQREHYMSHGIFEAVHNPTIKSDLDPSCYPHIGKTLRWWANIRHAPIMDNERYLGQLRFNCDEFPGWVPEEDLTDLHIVADHIDPYRSFGHVREQYVYLIHLIGKKAIRHHLGKGYEDTPVMIISREYDSPSDTFIRTLFPEGTPQPRAIYHTVWNGEPLNELSFKTINYDLQGSSPY